MSRFELLELRRLDHYVDLALRGRCTAYFANSLHDAFEKELAGGASLAVLVDCSALEEIEGTCVHELVLASRQLRARRGALGLYGLESVVAESLREAGLLDDLETYPTWSAAREAADASILRARRVAAATRILSQTTDTATLSRRSLRHKDGERVGRLLERILG
ncbi:MAG: STAS domain-containing protein [Acidobacteriota bacterium]